MAPKSVGLRGATRRSHSVAQTKMASSPQKIKKVLQATLMQRYSNSRHKHFAMSRIGESWRIREVWPRSDAMACNPLQVALMYGLVDEDGEYDEDAVRALQEELADAEAASNEEKRDSTKHDMKFHWLIFVSCFIVAVAGGVSKTLDTLQWGWDNTVLANVSVAWVVINMVPFGMALGYAYLPHQRTVRRHGTALRPDSVRT
mmetsp:Transcript_2133/g.5859  ORF Transcript_2133/g.5859 Transcript_2133/m.5859 type:complete len:202 (+) Transcript_2133:2981-3586(+)